MDNLDSAIEYGYITEKEAELLELLRMPAKDAKPPKGVPKTHVPKKKGKIAPKETLKKLSPKQKATLKAKTDGKVEKTKDGIDTFYMEGSTTGNVKDSKPSDSKTSSSGSSYNGSGGGGKDAGANSPSGDAGKGTTGGGNQGSQGSNGGGGHDSGANSPSGDKGAGVSKGGQGSQGSPGSYDGPAKHNPNGMQGSQAKNAYSGQPTANNAAYNGSKPTTVNGIPSTPGNVDGKADRENVTTISMLPDKNRSTVYKDPNLSKPQNQPYADYSPAQPSDLDDVMPSVTAAERAVMNKVKSPTSFARIDSPSSLANLGSAGSMFESPLADRPGVYSGTELSNIVGGNTPPRANAPTREAYADNIASDPTVGRTNDSLASLAGNPEKITDRMTPGSTMAENYAAYRSPPTQASVEAARAAILGDVAQAAGTLTAPYDVKASVAQPAGTFTAGYDVKNPAAVAAGTLTTPYNPADDSVEDLTQEAYNRANAIPGVEPAKAAGTLTSPYNVAAKPDSPLSPLATAKPRALGVDKYTGSGTSSLASLSTPQAPPANDNDSTIADQNFPDTSTITDQNLPGGLPSPPSGGAPTFGQGGQGAQVTGTAPAPVTPPVVTPPPPVVEQTDPYAGIMPWDRIAYDAIRTSYESRGETYTPQQFITSFYNQKKAA